MSNNGFFGDLEEPVLDCLATDAELPDLYDATETFDAFNEDTFGAPIEGDWESEHDKLLMLENENGFDGTLTKFDDFDDVGRGSDNEIEELSRNRDMKQQKKADHVNHNNFRNDIPNGFPSSNDAAKQNYEVQLKLLQQLQIQQQQQQQLMQQQLFQKQNQLLQTSGSNSASISPQFMLTNEQKNHLLQQQQQQQVMALMARNAAQMQQNSNNNSTNLYNQLPFSGNIVASDINGQRRTPVSMRINESGFNNMNINNNYNNDSQKIQSFLEKMIPHGIAAPSGFNQDGLNQHQNATGNTNNNSRPLSMLAMLQQQQQVNVNPLPKLPSAKVKTLEEIENELLASNQPSKSSAGISDNSSMQKTQGQTASSDSTNLSKLFSMLNTGNQNVNQQILKQQLQQQQIGNNIETELLILKQKQLLEQFELSQKQAQLQQLKQQSILNPSNSNLDQQQFMLMQQQLLSQMNLNSFLPPNFQSLNQQQKQLVLAQIHKNMQIAMLQQQQHQQQQQQQQQQQLLDNNDLNNNRYNDNMKMQQRNMANNNNINNRNSNNMMYNNRNNNQGKLNNNNNNKSNSKSNSLNGDKLAGMMTDKEKNWVTNVQMLQLQIDDPYRYDFYYTAWMLKKKQFAQRNTSSAGLKTSVIHTLDNKYNTNLNRDPKSYRPLTFENSLGKVTMSNFHHPRALIDVKSGDDQVGTDLSTSIGELDIDEKSSIDKEKNIDTILLEIEKMYQVLLNIDEIEHSILKANEEMRALLFQDRRAKVDKLALMLCTDNFAHYLFIDKGKRLLSKCIPTFNIAQTKLILTFIMQYTYIIAKNNICLDELYSHISYAIDTQKFADLVNIVNAFVTIYSRYTEKTNLTIFSNKFCLSFLLKFFSKSDLISQDDFEAEQKATWSCFLNMVLAGLMVIKPVSVDTFNVCETIQMNLDTLIDNFDIDKGLWEKSERTLRQLFSSV